MKNVPLLPSNGILAIAKILDRSGCTSAYRHLSPLLSQKKYHPKKWKSKYWIVFTIDYLLHQTPYFTIYRSIYILFVYPFLRIHILPFSKVHPARGDPLPHRLRLCLLGHTKDQARGVRSARRLHRTGCGRHRRLSTLGSNRRGKWDPIGSNPSIGAKHRSIGATTFSRTRSALTLLYRRKNIRNMCIYIYIWCTSMHTYM